MYYVAGTLDVTHLIKLIPLEDRPKGQVNTVLTDMFSLIWARIRPRLQYSI